MSLIHNIAEFFNEGGWTMYVTASAGVVGIVIAVEKGIKLYKDQKQDTRLFMARVKELMMQDRMEDALQFCNLNSAKPLPKIVKAGLERLGCDEAIVRQSMECAYLDETPKVTEKIGYLSLIANAGLLFGLLGTVLGLIRQFSALAAIDGGQKQELMAKGIAEAMNNTALGLMVALPALVIHGIYAAKASHIMEDLERGSSQFLDWVGLYNYGQLKAKPNGKGNSSSAQAVNKTAA